MATTKKAPAKTKVSKAVAQKASAVKNIFLYVLIGGLVVSALISIVAILIGEFNDVIQKALGTTFLVMTHCLLILLLIIADKNNQIGRSLIPSVITAALFANIFTSTFGIWEIWKSTTSWDFVSFYFLAIGTAFILRAVKALYVKQKSVVISAATTSGSAILLAAVVTPWIFSDDPSTLGSFYFRLVGAATVLVATALMLTVILNRIAVSKKPSLAKSVKKEAPLGGGMLAIVIVIGVITFWVWLGGIATLISNGAEADNPPSKCLAYYSYDWDDNRHCR